MSHFDKHILNNILKVNEKIVQLNIDIAKQLQSTVQRSVQRPVRGIINNRRSQNHRLVIQRPTNEAQILSEEFKRRNGNGN